MSDEKPSSFSLPVFIATGFYSGLSPIAPGTAGSIAALGLFLVFAAFSPTVLTTGFMIGVAVLLTAASVVSSNICLDRGIFGTDSSDPKQIVIDEFAGMAVALIGVGTSIEHVLLAFVAFRFFDIVKLPPIDRLEKLPRGWGITADDILAGVYANIGVQLTMLLTGSYGA